MTRPARLAAVAAILFCSMLLAERAIVKTKDGNTYDGEYREQDGNVVLKIHGVDTIIPRDQVASIEPVGSYEQELRGQLAKLDASDVAGRVALARQAFDRREYAVARDALEGALAVDPNSREATDLLGLVQSQIRLERNQQAPAPPVARPPAAPPAPAAALDRVLLTPADIQTIRRNELHSGDTAARITFEGDVKKRFAESRNMPYAEFNALSPAEQAIRIFRDGTPDMQEKVRVQSEPATMIEFRNRIQPLVIQNCATTACHGGPAGGRLIVYTSRANNDAVLYTNFYILQSFSKKVESAGAVFGSPERRLIDRGRAEQSLLPSLGLPADVAEVDHPLVNGRPITPIFRSKDDARYKLVVDWINGMSKIEPEYGIVFTPPAATQPATQPTE